MPLERIFTDGVLVAEIEHPDPPVQLDAPADDVTLRAAVQTLHEAGMLTQGVDAALTVLAKDDGG